MIRAPAALVVPGDGTDAAAGREATGPLALRRYVPQFDGVRAVAISAVVAYHLGYLRGGWVGVDVFFVLSGYLITSLLLAEGRPPGNIVSFWGRRARRLLPAVLVLLVALSVYAAAGGPGLVPAQLRSPALATLFYVANWQQIAAGHSYFARFLSVSPLQQTWSLAIEEQYYLVWPPLVAVVALSARARGIRQWRGILLGATVSLAVASAVWMGVAAHVYGANRAYLGTDTRAWELLLGGAVAMVWPPDRQVDTPWPVVRPHRGRTGRSGRRGVGGRGAARLDLGRGPGGHRRRAPPSSSWEPCGHRTASWGAVLALGPVRWIGLISYSLYLWHWPVIVLMTTDTIGWSGAALLAARLATMVALSCASYYLIERPLRRADWGALHRRLHVPTVGFAAAGVVVTAAVILVGTVGPPVGHDGRGGRRHRHRRRPPPCPRATPISRRPRLATPTGCGCSATA